MHPIDPPRRTGACAAGFLIGLLWLAGLLLPAAAPAAQVYVSGSTGNAISPFLIGGSGSLTPISCPGSNCTTGSQPIGVAISPNGQYLYTSSHGSSRVSPFSIGSGGSLTPISCSGSNCNTGTNPYGIAVRPGGQYVYTANLGANTVSAFSIGSGGSLSPVSCPGSNCNTGTDPYGVAVTPNGQFLYTANRVSETVSAFSIGSGGSLTPISCPGSNCNTGTQPQAISVSPNGQFLYVANRGTARVSVYSIAGNGSLTPVSCTTNCNTGAAPMSMAVTPNGQRLYTVNRTAETVSAFTIGSGGALTPISCPGSNCNTGPIPGGIAVSPNSAYVYVSNFGSNKVSPYSIGSGGSLTPISCPGSNCNTAAGPDFMSLVVSPDQAPTAAFSAPDNQLGQLASFNGSASTAAPGQSVARYDWNFGDGQTLPNGGPTPTHTYGSEGDYTVTLTVTDNAGCSTTLIYTGQTASCNGSSVATTTDTVTVDGTPPNTIIDSPRVLTTADQTPTFDFHSTDPGATFECSIDTGTPSFGPCSGPGASHTPASPLANGLYAFRVRATDQLGNTGVAAVEIFRVDTVIHPPRCPAVSSSVTNYGPALGRIASAASPRTVEGVRARITVDQPSLLQIRAKLAWRRNGRSRTTDLGERTLPISDPGNLRLALPASLGDDLPRGTPVTLRLRIAATPDSSPGCTNPSVDRVSLRTRVVKVPRESAATARALELGRLLARVI